MLISLKSGAVGLNLTAANNVFLVSRLFIHHLERTNGSVIRGGNLLLRLKLLIVFIEYDIRTLRRKGADEVDGPN
jgi:hypothetical protein